LSVDQYVDGQSLLSVDKQLVRDYFEPLDWNETPPGLPLPKDAIAKRRPNIANSFECLRGKSLNLQELPLHKPELPCYIPKDTGFPLFARRFPRSRNGRTIWNPHIARNGFRISDLSYGSLKPN
jgi:hypothetical protein